ncbi:DUF2069 domain-containing protein [Lysobacter pythonis]|uniref:DUF2069 domain-containing protein n=1 Tax=Solilutibacter pythonis TaxID=2483112 RepID=A0A3M2HM76_9GAMM|nr:DUF2069 domain-containing protein [Lysobacter pythonis]RMH89475.1 DUF2069 domain-containing protein [Lysobacter pythonis]
MSGAHRLLVVALIALAALFALGFRGQPVTLAFASLPPALLAAAILLGMRSAPFWASVFALGWFSYGVMESWTMAGHARAYALGIAVVAVAIILAGSWAGLMAKFGPKPGA